MSLDSLNRRTLWSTAPTDTYELGSAVTVRMAVSLTRFLAASQLIVICKLQQTFTVKTYSSSTLNHRTMNYIFLVLCHKIHFTCEYVRRCTYGVWLRIVSVIRQKSLGVHVHIRSLWRQGGAPLKHHEETWADIRQATLNWHRVEKFSFSKRYIPELSNNKHGNLLQF